MASKFLVWVNTPISSGSNANVVTYATFESSSGERYSGFVPGTGASAQYVNSIVRQNSLVVSALMGLVDNSSLDFNSNVSDVQAALSGYFANLTTLNSTYASKIGTSASHPAIGDKDRVMRVDSSGNLLGDGYFIPKLNNANQTSAAKFYAPTDNGTSGQVLVANGSNNAPTFVNQSTLSVGSATNDEYGNNISDTYATNYGTYPNMTVGTANKATYDINNNNIVNTYATKDSVKTVDTAMSNINITNSSQTATVYVALSDSEYAKYTAGSLGLKIYGDLYVPASGMYTASIKKIIEMNKNCTVCHLDDMNFEYNANYFTIVSSKVAVSDASTSSNKRLLVRLSEPKCICYSGTGIGGAVVCDYRTNYQISIYRIEKINYNLQ